MAKPINEISAIELAGILTAFGVDIGQWGNGQAKSVGDLLKELKIGESSLRIDANGLARVLRVVKMIIEDPKRGLLFEDYQILPDGRRRDRNHSPGGKISHFETLTGALAREMSEELGLTKDQYCVNSVSVESEERPSRSYPGLRSVYEVHCFKIRLVKSVKIENGHRTIDREDGKQIFFHWVKI